MPLGRAILFLSTAALAVAQEAGRDPARAALDAWLASDHSDPKLLEAAVAAVLDAGGPALAAVGERARRARTAENRHEARGLDAVVTHVTIGFLQRAGKSGMIYRGQYDDLRALQPFVGELLLRLLLDTPDWFSQSDRHGLAFPLRDVFSEPPADEVVKRVKAAATDEDFEPQAVRQNLAFLLAHWGDRSLIDARIAQVTRDAEDESIDATRRAALRYELADIHYTLGEYEQAAQIHVDMLRRAETAGAELRPVYYYNAACCLARAGARQAALAELERAVELMRSGRVDPSHMLERKLFEADPDLDAVRGDPRFAELVRAAFESNGDRRGADRRKDH
ncbi:MAG TPA: hypothetical protein VK081_06545 [Planctomycetota bacterium]|nr:hypothetical protein [Planctomycetota bacterium]